MRSDGGIEPLTLSGSSCFQGNACIPGKICTPYLKMAWEVGFEPTIMVLETKALDQTKLHPYILVFYLYNGGE